jgi:hypothetical protein
MRDIVAQIAAVQRAIAVARMCDAASQIPRLESALRTLEAAKAWAAMMEPPAADTEPLMAEAAMALLRATKGDPVSNPTAESRRER